MNYETIAKAFMKLVEERYPNQDKILSILNGLGLKDPRAKIIVLSRMRDAVDQVSMRQLFGEVQKRDELKAAILQTLEGLEDDVDYMEDEEGG